MASPQNSPEVIDVDADEPPRIAGGTGKPDAPLEIASSDSEDERRPPAKRAKPAPVPAPERALPDGDGVTGASFTRLAGFSFSESDDASSSGWLASPVPRLMRGDGGTSTIIASSGEAIYDFFKHSASDDAGVSVSK